MEQEQNGYIPESVLTSRLERLRAKINTLTQQIEDYRREEKVVASILQEAARLSGQSRVRSNSVPPRLPNLAGNPTRPDRSKGVVDGILSLIHTRPGITRDELVEGLKHLNLQPFDANAARRIILNNLGNLLRGNRVREDDVGRLYPFELTPGDPEGGDS